YSAIPCVLPSEPPASLSSATSTVFKNEMNHKYSIFLAGVLLSLCGQLFGQPADTNSPATNAPAINAEQSDASSNNAASEFWNDLTPGPGGMNREVIVSFHDVVLKSNDTARSVVVIGANARIEGKVRDAVVVIGGDMTVSGHIRDAAVAVLGDIHALKGAK